MLNREDCHVIRTDACSHGLKDPTTGSYMLKPTALITSHPAFDILGTRCPGSHEHIPIAGAAKCRVAARYTRKFARRVVRALERAVWTPQDSYAKTARAYTVKKVHGTKKAQVVNPADTQEEDPLGARAITFGIPVKRRIARTLKRLHQNLAHPSNIDLVRNLRLSGATSEVLEAAKVYDARRARDTRKLSPRSRAD